jgi:hypothetical protein
VLPGFIGGDADRVSRNRDCKPAALFGANCRFHRIPGCGGTTCRQFGKIYNQLKKPTGFRGGGALGFGEGFRKACFGPGKYVTGEFGARAGRVLFSPGVDRCPLFHQPNWFTGRERKPAFSPWPAGRTSPKAPRPPLRQRRYLTISVGWSGAEFADIPMARGDLAGDCSLAIDADNRGARPRVGQGIGVDEVAVRNAFRYDDDCDYSCMPRRV